MVSAVLLGVTGSRRGVRKWSDDIEERGEAMLRSDTSDVCENSLLSLSLTLKDDSAPGGGVEWCAYAAAFAADLKLLVEGGCRKPA